MEDLNALSLLPILVTLFIALWTKNVILGLFSGIVVGVFMITGYESIFNPLDTFAILIKKYLVSQVVDSYNAGVLVLLVFIGGFVALMEKSGGGSAFAKKVTNYINTKFRSQIASWFGGIIIFFSDLGTPLIVGPVFRPIYDKLKISRQKLAFILDSTSSPVAILVPFIGWGVYIMGLIQKEFTALNLATSDWEAFIQAIPFQFYAFLAIFIIPLIAYKNLDFGPMAQAEEDAKNGIISSGSAEVVEAFTHENAKSSFVWAPLLIMGIVLLTMLIPLGFPFQKVSGSAFRAALSSAYFFAALTLILLMFFYKVRTIKDSIDLYLKGMGSMMQVIIILVLAWALSTIGKELGAASYIAQQAQNGFPYWLVPAIAFLLSAIISFATGSSWGTFAIMMPLVIPTAVAIDAALYVSIAAVLSGGLFGDHSSPISETTILSSTGANCNQFDHFKTQLPYAVLNGIISFFYFILAGIYPNPLILLGALCTQVILVYLISKYYGSKNQSNILEKVKRGGA